MQNWCWRSALCVIVTTTCATAGVPQLGSRMPCRAEGQQLVIASAQMSPACTTRSHDIEFTVAGRREIEFVETRDPRFLTPEGIHVGSTLNDVRAAGGSQLRPEPGWRFF